VTIETTTTQLDMTEAELQEAAGRRNHETTGE
jgi:hypothetical protein